MTWRPGALPGFLLPDRFSCLMLKNFLLLRVFSSFSLHTHYFQITTGHPWKNRRS
jgi:hypothetical protein